jgi:hypothetical protein
LNCVLTLDAIVDEVIGRVSLTADDVCYWHLASFRCGAESGRFWIEADIAGVYEYTA